MGTFDGRRVVVTGTASGAGRASAQAINDAGGSVIGVDIADQGDVPWTTVQADLSKSDDVERVLGEIGDVLGEKVDLLHPAPDDGIVPVQAQGKSFAIEDFLENVFLDDSSKIVFRRLALPDFLKLRGEAVDAARGDHDFL